MDLSRHISLEVEVYLYYLKHLRRLLTTQMLLTLKGYNWVVLREHFGTLTCTIHEWKRLGFGMVQTWAINQDLLFVQFHLGQLFNFSKASVCLVFFFKLKYLFRRGQSWAKVKSYELNPGLPHGSQGPTWASMQPRRACTSRKLRSELGAELGHLIWGTTTGLNTRLQPRIWRTDNSVY